MPRKNPEDRREYYRAYYQKNRERQIANAKAWNEAHPEERRAGHRKWYESKGRAQRQEHKDEYNAYQRAWNTANPERSAHHNRVQRMRRYGLDIARYEEMWAAQDGRCAICKKVETHRGRNGEAVMLAVDHNHSTGAVRALLCHACNTGIGSFIDDPALLRAAAEYIEESLRD